MNIKIDFSRRHVMKIWIFLVCTVLMVAVSGAAMAQSSVVQLTFQVDGGFASQRYANQTVKFVYYTKPKEGALYTQRGYVEIAVPPLQDQISGNRAQPKTVSLTVAQTDCLAKVETYVNGAMDMWVRDFGGCGHSHLTFTAFADIAASTAYIHVE
jgi:hypothetical protein